MRIGKQQYALMRAMVLAPVDQQWTKAQQRVLAGLVERGLAELAKDCHHLTPAGQEALLLLLQEEAGFRRD
jgi:hypothetical protein